jgi:hypothetical protein
MVRELLSLHRSPILNFISLYDLIPIAPEIRIHLVHRAIKGRLQEVPPHDRMAIT